MDIEGSSRRRPQNRRGPYEVYVPGEGERELDREDVINDAALILEEMKQEDDKKEDEMSESSIEYKRRFPDYRESRVVDEERAKLALIEVIKRKTGKDEIFEQEMEQIRKDASEVLDLFDDDIFNY
ncbi:MAG: hypothetical protein ABEJ02_04415 [Candidatus Paceibacteria bacterium]